MTTKCLTINNRNHQIHSSHKFKKSKEHNCILNLQANKNENNKMGIKGNDFV